MNRIQLSILSTVTATLLAAGAGCNCSQSGEKQSYQDPFFKVEDTRQIEKVGRQQAASAARADATLQAAHFHADGKLNSLGEQKIDLMLQDDDSSRPISVYIDIVEDTRSAGRRESVEAFLVASGLGNDQFKLENGPNPNGSGTPAAQLLKNLSKTDSIGASAGGGVSQ